MAYMRRSPVLVRSAAEPPPVYLDAGVAIRREDLSGPVGVGCLQQECGPEHEGAVVGQERAAGNESLTLRKLGGLGCTSCISA